MTLIQRKQLSAIFSAYVRAENFTADGANDNVTSAITTVLSTAGNGGVSVPVQLSSGVSVIGIIAASPNNRVEIYANNTKQKIVAPSGSEIYGRLTESTGVYTLTYYTNEAGTETAYTSFSSRAIDFEFGYRFDFARLPADAIIGTSTRNVSQDPAATSGSPFSEIITVTGTNTLASLTKTPTSANSTFLIVFQSIHTTLGGASADFSVNTSTRALTWSSTNAGYSLEPGDFVVAYYFTNE